MSRGHEAAVKSCFIHTRENVADTFTRSSQQGQNVFTQTQSQLQLLRVSGTCTHKVSHCLTSSCHTISHLCFFTATCPVKVHLVELHAACCSNLIECCKKDDFYRGNSSGACVCGFTTDLTNHRQQRNGSTYRTHGHFFGGVCRGFMTRNLGESETCRHNSRCYRRYLRCQLVNHQA